MHFGQIVLHRDNLPTKKMQRKNKSIFNRKKANSPPPPPPLIKLLVFDPLEHDCIYVYKSAIYVGNL